MDNWHGNTVVVTSVITDFEHQGNQIFQDGVDYIYFTDGASLPLQDRWKIEYVPETPRLDPRRMSKLPKHYPEFFDVLRSYRYMIWIDGDMQIISSDFVPEIMSYMKNGLVLSPHFDNRNCAYGEATIRPPKYALEPLDEQVSYYKSIGFPVDNGLYETGVMARDLSNPKVREVCMAWYLQNLVFSYQDQVSLPYVLWDQKFKPDILPKSFRDFEWVHINAHKSER